ncbi:two-component sensor histidine kinase [Streptomyces paromomycinus]|uniref:histidine kinase n=1 Tax=Streptomyces paromomycinus TaxID=92743 RepID=A0A401W4S0_STREY|nr:two-component sensor histidine kinase [Streptomyces paromomycinus]
MVSAVLLIAVVCAVIGTVTTIALHSYLQNQLDGKLRESAQHSGGRQGDFTGHRDLGFIAGPGQPIGTVGARVSAEGDITAAARSIDARNPLPAQNLVTLTDEQKQALAAVPRDGRPHTVTLPDLGDYRVESAPDDSALVGLPAGEVQDVVARLVVVEVCVTAAGLVAAGLAGAATVRIALWPLRRVAATATRVSELPLHRGEVALHERVPAAEADPRTEVGQVGAALNRMLGHVGSALAARQESETRVRRFVADASHELRTPLASIRGYAELTRRGREEPGPATRHALGRIESEAERMTGLVEDLLLLARLDSGRPLSYECTDLVPLVVDAVSDARAAGPRHRWRLELPADPVPVRADADRLHQVLVNLLANARTHTPEGTTVVACLRREMPMPGAGHFVRLEVRDDGPGVPPELLPHVFERFARGDASRSRTGRETDRETRRKTGRETDRETGRETGRETIRETIRDADGTGGTRSTGSRNSGSTGLGLAIVEAVVAAHGGTVGVESVPGRTVFRVRLPAGGPARDVTRAPRHPHTPLGYAHSQPGHSGTTQG